MNNLTTLSLYFADIAEEVKKVDVSFRVLSFLLAVCVALLVPLIYKLYKWGRIMILNAHLKYVPRNTEFKKLSFCHKCILLPFKWPGCLLNFIVFLLASTIIIVIDIICRLLFQKEILPNTFIIVILFIDIVFFIGRIMLIRKEVKGLVGILATYIKEVANSENRNKDTIHFAYCYDKIKGNISYEKRLPFKKKDEVDEERERVIVPYYTKLKEEIDRRISSKYSQYFKVYYKGNELHICDFLRDHAYSTNNLWKAVLVVDKRMHNEHLINFIGDKVGVWDYELNKHKLTLSTYQTDHFTFHVFKEIFHGDEFKETFQLFIRRVNLVDENTRKYMVQCLKFLFSSFGIDITINTRDAKGKKVMLVGLRNGAIERLGNDKLHVPVNESFSNTDLTNDKELSPFLCVRRGIVEELGIPEDVVEKATIEFYDFAIVCDEGEIGLSCNADFSSIMPVEEMRCYPGQDKFLEMKELIAVPYPPFYWDAMRYPYYFYKSTHNDALCAQWESFTPLLYQRIIVRKASLGIIWNLFFTFVFSAFFSAVLMFIYYGLGFNEKWCLYLATTFVTLFINICIQLVLT